jgi:LuxR family transcriptional regulator, maltose regulon positive regulatory protein
MTYRQPNSRAPSPASVERFRPPAISAHEIVRLRLLDRLIRPAASSATAHVTLVRGPAGFGKTTLLAQAYRQVVAHGNAAVWLHCDSEDADPDSFLDSLYRASTLIGTDPRDSQFTAAELAARLADVDRAVHVFIDEFERLAGTPAEAMLERLLVALPCESHVILGSRQAPRSWFVIRELAGLATTVDAFELRLTSEEVLALLPDALNASEAAQLEELTEGWPMAVQLARLRSRDRPALADLLNTLERGTPGLFEYLTERIVESLSPDQQSFLRDTSILQFITPLAVNALMQRDDGYALIGSVMHLQPIVTVTSDAELTIRLHPLFRQFMRDLLGRSGHLRERDLHRRAAVFFSHRGRILQAVQHANEAEDAALAVTLIERAGGEQLIFTAGPRTTHSVLMSVSQAARQRSVRLQFAEVVLAAVDGRHATAMMLRERFIAALSEAAARDCDALHGLDARWSHFAAAMAELVCEFLQDPYSGARDGALSRAHELDGFCRRQFGSHECFLGFVLAFGVLLTARHGRLSEARRWLEDYDSLCVRNGYAPNMPSINPQRAMLAFLEGDFSTARSLLEKSALTGLDPFGEPELHMLQLCKSLLAVMLYECGELEQAHALTESLRTDLDASFPEVPTLSSRIRILCTATARGAEQADSLLSDLLREAAKRGAHRLTLYLRALRLEIQLRDSEAVTCDGDFPAIHEFLVREIACMQPSWIMVDQCARAVVPVLVNMQRSEEAEALALALCNLAAGQGRIHQQAVSLILIAIARASSRPNEAIEALRDALALTSETGAVQPYADLARRITHLMIAAVAKGGSAHFAEHGRRVLRALTGTNTQTPDLWHSLSERERDILLVLTAHASTKAIARTLGLSPETVKHHLKRIFTKLGVHSREQALARMACPPGDPRARC